MCHIKCEACSRWIWCYVIPHPLLYLNISLCFLFWPCLFARRIYWLNKLAPYLTFTSAVALQSRKKYPYRCENTLCKRQVKEKKSETAKNECNSCNIVCVALSQRYNSGTIWVLVPLLIDVIRCQPYLDAERENLMWLFCMTNAGHGNNNNRWANFQIEFTSTKDAKKSWNTFFMRIFTQ